jgi:small GTP-binding protein
MISSNFIETIKSVESLIAEFQGLINYEKKYNEQSSYIQELDKSLLTLSRKCQTQSFQIAVLALVKSGKSTFTNALLGNEYLPTSNVPETSRIVRILHSSDMPNGKLIDGEQKTEGVENIKNYLKDLNEVARRENIQPSEDEIMLYAPITVLSEKELSGVTFQILDTPGPNEAGAEQLRLKVDRLLEEVDVIIYLLDYTKLRTQEEKELIDKLKVLRSDILNSDRLFFVVNKIDLKGLNGLTPEQTVDYVYKLLQEQNLPYLDKSKILTVSSEKALLARLVNTPNPSETVINYFKTKYFGEEAEDKTIADCREKSGIFLSKSGLIDIENKIISFIYENRSKILFDIIFGDLSKQITSFQNYLATAESTLSNNSVNFKLQIDKIEEDIEDAKKKLQQITEKSKLFEETLTEWINKKFTSFELEAIDIIDMAFDKKINEKRKQEKENESFDFTELGEAVVEILSFWKPALGKFVKMALRRSKNTINLLSKVATNIAKLNFSSNSKSEIYETISNVNNSISNLFMETFATFRDDLEREAVGKQKELFAEFSVIINQASRQIEEKIGKTLNITLQEVPISFPNHTINEMHSQIDNLIKTNQSTHKQKIKKGWCQNDEEKETTTYHYTLDNKSIKEFWINEVKEMNRVSLITSQKLIKSSIQDAIDNAKTKFEKYAESYLSIIKREEQEKRKGVLEVDKRVKIIKEQNNKLNKIKQQLVDLK